jgi:hypothetical protein
MAFRRAGSDDRNRSRAWRAWTEQLAATLKSIGLPPRVYLDLGYWKDFLENGHLHRHSESSTGFEFAQLSPPQMHRLLAFLETQNEFKPEYYPLPGWLRVRLGVETTEQDTPQP